MSKRPSPDTVTCIDLTGSDDEDRKLSPAKTTTIVTAAGTKQTCVDLTPDDEDSDQESRLGDMKKQLDRKLAATAASSPSGGSDEKPSAKRVKMEGRTVTPSEFAGDDDIELVAPTARPMVPVARTPSTTTTTTAGADEDVEVVGYVNEHRLPHMRQHCTRYKFDAKGSMYGLYAPSTLATNKECCDLCYCYVCDAPVKDCKSWRSATSRQTSGNHCCASDQNHTWVRLRAQKKGTSTILQAAAVRSVPHFRDLDSDSDDSFLFLNCFYNSLDEDSDEDSYGGYGAYGRYERPRGPFAPDSKEGKEDDDSLTKCRKCGWFSRFDNDYDRRTRPTSDDWCLRCGRVASPKDFGKQQMPPRQPQEGEVCLGTKEIPFRIKAHDPRKFHPFSLHWRTADNASAEWNYSETDMEEDAFLHCLGKNPLLDPLVRRIALSSDTNEKTDVIIIEKEDHIAMLKAADDGNCAISTSWDRTSRSGTITLQVFVPKSAFERPTRGGSQYPVLLGNWFEILPLPVSEVGTFIEAEVDALPRMVKYMPSSMSSESKDSLRRDLTKAVEEHNAARKAALSKLSLLPSSGSLSCGHVCWNDNSFCGLLKRYYKEKLPKMILSGRPFAPSLIKAYRGLETHASLATNPLGSKGFAFAKMFLNENSRVLYQSGRSTQEVMTRLENIGHDRIDFVDGLNVELLDFQSQTLKWALERETLAGGIQSLIWAQLPEDPTRKQKLFYNPILNMFRKDPPALVRGGFIAEEMGLGKTVISLALILKNPAPMAPLSGSPVQALQQSQSSADANVTWDMSPREQTSTRGGRRGSILSRATLVICPVSLVGQWIDEARSKLQDPGLVYPYHGQSRKRDAMVLARNSIVVTTYQVLASDSNYHSQKKGAGPDYCPPLEQIRWWRVICDEGHLLKQGNTERSRAVLSLVADHKWIVSGTPFNTSFKDLLNQMRFLGMEKITELGRCAFGIGGRGTEPCLASIQLLLGSMMMRHSHKQKYRGTSTTLMSLPPKTERIVTVSFSTAETADYTKLEKSAHAFYVKFREHHRGEIKRHFLLLSQKLMPLRVACAGGKYPVQFGKADGDREAEEESEDGHKKKAIKTKPVKYSDFVFTSKFKVLLAELESTRDKDPSSKSLVFSQFTSTLQWLQEELPKHGFQFRTLSGDMSMRQRAKALHDFQSDPPTTIFLLSMRAGAVGINLTQANRVYLMEPSFNPALEQQAIGRVHRLGQTRPVEVVRLVHGESVESRMMKMLEKKYGKSFIGTAEDKTNGETTEEKGPSTPMLGNVSTDRATMMMDEFDLLFGVDSLTCEDSSEEGTRRVLSDSVMSSASM